MSASRCLPALLVLGFLGMAPSSALTAVVQYTLENVILDDGGALMSGAFTWTYAPGDFENGTGEFTSLDIPYTTHDHTDLLAVFDVGGSIEITLEGSVHDDGVDITLFLLEPLTPTTGSDLDLARSAYEIGGNGFHTGSFLSGRVAPVDIPGPGLEVAIVPTASPVLIPAAGGSFAYDVLIRNATAADITADVVIQAVLPGGTIHPVLFRGAAVFPAGSTLVRTGLVQDVPASAPAGAYLYRLGAVQSGAAIGGDQFPFEKQVVGLGAGRVGDWTSSAEDLLFPEDGAGESPLPAPVAGKRAGVPAMAILHGAFPNPFNARTVVAFTLSRQEDVELEVLDVAGRVLTSLLAGETLPAGRHEIVWDGLDKVGRPAASGTYVFRLSARGQVVTSKAVLLK
ncbi:T9SS type A sorting domain-containing protein [bacterium]|nr:T9SS type A sorting domain-containing protein [bacterium]